MISLGQSFSRGEGGGRSGGLSLGTPACKAASDTVLSQSCCETYRGCGAKEAWARLWERLLVIGI